MHIEDARGLFRSRRERPIVVIESAAENYSVAAREHITAAQVTVINLSLRHQHLELATHRAQLLIIKQGARAQARAVEDDGLRQAHDFFMAAKFFDDHAPAGDIKVTQQRAERNLSFVQHRAELLYKRKAEIMFRVAMNFNRRIEVVAAREIDCE